jgi:hypothetical protein
MSTQFEALNSDLKLRSLSPFRLKHCAMPIILLVERNLINQRIPMNAQNNPSEIKCPSCGRYVGAYPTCPYCQASMQTRVSLKVVKLIAVTGSFIGLLLLWIGVKYQEIPKIQIGSIDYQNNMSVVRLEGTITDVRLEPAKDSFRFTIDDGTGHATLSGFSKLKQFKNAMGDNFPQMGDKISAAGNLNISDNFGVTMFLASARRVSLISRSPVTDLCISQISQDSAGRLSHFTAAITEVTKFNKGRNLTVKDTSGEMPLVVFDTELESLPAAITQAFEKPGARIKFLGKIELYRDKLQLRLVQPDNPANLQVMTGDTPDSSSGGVPS